MNRVRALLTTLAFTRELAQQFVIFLSGPVGKPLFVAAGVTD